MQLSRRALGPYPGASAATTARAGAPTVPEDQLRHAHLTEGSKDERLPWPTSCAGALGPFRTLSSAGGEGACERAAPDDPSGDAPGRPDSEPALVARKVGKARPGCASGRLLPARGAREAAADRLSAGGQARCAALAAVLEAAVDRLRAVLRRHGRRGRLRLRVSVDPERQPERPAAEQRVLLVGRFADGQRGPGEPAERDPVAGSVRCAVGLPRGGERVLLHRPGRRPAGHSPGALPHG